MPNINRIKQNHFVSDKRQNAQVLDILERGIRAYNEAAEESRTGQYFLMPTSSALQALQIKISETQKLSEFTRKWTEVAESLDKVNLLRNFLPTVNSRSSVQVPVR